MINPDIFLAAFVPLTAYYVASCARQLWREKSGKHGNIFGDVILLFTVVLLMVILDTPPAPLRLAAKAFVVAGMIAATILRLVARSRFAVEP